MPLRAGDIVAIPYRGVQHQGLVSVGGDVSTARIVHASKRTGVVCEESAEVFAAGRPLEVIARSPHPEPSIAYARSLIGEPWTYTKNCQTFARRVCGAPVRSRDAERVAVASLALACGAFLLRPL